MKKIRFVFKYFVHSLTARNSGGHGVHSPLIYNFIQCVLREKHPYYCFDAIEKIRKNNLNDHRKIDVEDFGSGRSETRMISEIASKALKPARQAQLLFRTIQYFRFEKVMELGTSLGISTLYMTAASLYKSCITLEGSSAIAAVARANFQQMGLSNITLIEGNISEQLIYVLNEYGQQDLVFIDANHRYEPLKRYFDLSIEHSHDKSVIIVDDIYWSDEMETAWREIKQHPRVTTTIDIFHMGIVFLNPLLAKKHYKVKY